MKTKINWFTRNHPKLLREGIKTRRNGILRAYFSQKMDIFKYAEKVAFLLKMEGLVDLLQKERKYEMWKFTF